MARPLREELFFAASLITTVYFHLVCREKRGFYNHLFEDSLSVFVFVPVIPSRQTQHNNTRSNSVKKYKCTYIF